MAFLAIIDLGYNNLFLPGSNNISLFAPIILRPVPPALELNKNTEDGCYGLLN